MTERMLTGYNLVYFGPGPWSGLWRNRHHLMTRFAQHNRVLYVEPAPYLRPVVRQLLQGQEGWQALRSPRLSQEQESLYVYHSPAFAPMSGRRSLNTITRTVRRALLLRAMQRLEMERPIVWLSRPEMGELIGQFHEQLTIYHVVDEYTAYQGVTEDLASWLRLQEKRLMAQVDLVIVVSPTLWEAKRSYNPHTYLVPNGVDLEAFNRAQIEKAIPPTDLNAIPEPRLVYAGLIGMRLDLTLLLAVARRHPDWSLVFIGQVDNRGCEDELVNLQALPNVHFLGMKPASAVPRYLLACQVCLLPYRRSEESRHIDPIKLYEGLASGKPIVSTPIPAVLPYSDLIWLASDDSEFETAVQEALTERDNGRVTRRQSIAAANTWEKRVEQISALIHSHLDNVE